MVKIISYSRLNLGLIDLTRQPFRIDGSTGFAIDLKASEITLFESQVCNCKLNCKNTDRIQNTLSNCIKKINNRNFSIEVNSYVDEHIGFGLGTQLNMSIVKAFDKEFKLKMNIDEMASLANSGGTSNIGVFSFLHGGFNVDSGRKFPDEKNNVGPGEIFLFNRLSPLLMRMDMPEWYICIVVPFVEKKVYGKIEVDFFHKYTPLSDEEVNKLCRCILTGLLPAVKCNDFDLFCCSIENCMSLGLKKREIDTYNGVVNESMICLKELGARGVGMSSFGPAVFGFFESMESAVSCYENLKKLNNFKNVYLTKPRNSGADVITDFYRD